MWALTVLIHVLHEVGLAFQLPGDLLGLHLLDAALLAAVGLVAFHAVIRWRFIII